MTIEEQERAAIMEFDGGVPRLEADRLARERPWDTDPTWGMPRPVHVEMFEDVGAVREPPSEPDYIRKLREKYCQK